jgi:hypothetical protein
MVANSIDDELQKATQAMAEAESAILDSSIPREQWFLMR